jgi:predicted amidohydrolase
VVLPELFHSGYAVRSSDEARSLAVSQDRESAPLSMCLDACRKFSLHIVAGFLEESDGKKLFNSAWLINQDGVSAAYRKVHLFHLEKLIFTPGDGPGPVTPVKTANSRGHARVGMQVCFDWIFPDPWGRLAWGEGDDPGPTGAQVIAHPANLVIPGKCPLALRARAMENRIFIVSAGRVGTDPGPDGEIEFRAGSIIIAPDGSVLAEGQDDRPDCDMVEINPEWADGKYVTPTNHVLNERFA